MRARAPRFSRRKDTKSWVFPEKRHEIITTFGFLGKKARIRLHVAKCSSYSCQVPQTTSETSWPQPVSLKERSILLHLYLRSNETGLLICSWQYIVTLGSQFCCIRIVVCSSSSEKFMRFVCSCASSHTYSP